MPLFSNGNEILNVINRMFKPLVRANCIGLLSTYFLTALAVFIALGSSMYLYVQSYRFCEDENQQFCVPCPSHATCQGLKIIKCDYGYVNNQYECLETTKTPQQLADLNDRIIRIFSQNVSVNANLIYERYFEKECSPTDFKAAVRYTHRWKTTPGGKRIVPIAYFSFKRANIPDFGFGTFTAVLATLWVCLFIARILYYRA